MPDFRYVRVLQAVARLGTVTAAAETLHMTPSAASQQVRKLERGLGVVLLERSGRGVRLSAAARHLVERAEEIDSRWQETQAELHAAATGEPTGTVRLCGFPTAASTLLIPTAMLLDTRHHTLDVHVREAETADCFDLLTAGDTDLAVAESMPVNPGADDHKYHQRPLLDDPFDLLVSADHPLADHGSVDLTDLADLPWVVGMPGSSCRQHVLAACAAAGFTPAIAHEAREWNLVAALVSHRMGVSLVPRLAQLPPHLAVTRLALRGSLTPSRKLVTYTRRGSRHHPAIAATERALHDVIARLPRPCRGRAVGGEFYATDHG